MHSQAMTELEKEKASLEAELEREKEGRKKDIERVKEDFEAQKSEHHLETEEELKVVFFIVEI